MEWRSRDWRDVRLWILGIFVAQAAAFADFSRHLYPTWDDCNNLRLLDLFLLGDWRELYHHASPGFYLLMLPFRAFGAGPMSLSAIVLQFHLWGLFLACRYGGQALGMGHAMRFWCFLALVLSPISQYTGHSFTIEGVSLFFLWLGLIMLWQKRPVSAGLSLGMAALVNYKLFLVLALLAGVAWLFRRPGRDIIPPKALLAFAGAFMGMLLLGCLPALFTGLAWYEYPRRLAAVLLRQGVNPDSAGESALDVVFYVRYLTEWDNLLFLPGLAAAAYSLFSRSMPPDDDAYGNEAVARRLFFLALAWILIFTFLPKAPRALYPILPALPLLAMLAAARTGRWLVWVVGPALVVASLVQSVRTYYRYGSKAYSEAAGRLSTLPGIAVAPRSMQLYPWIPAEIRTRMQPLPGCALPEARVPIALDDPYRFATGCLTDLDGSEELVLENKAIASPILWLEHCEFTGQTYARTLERRQNRRQAPLRILINAHPAGIKPQEFQPRYPPAANQ